MTQAKVPPP